VQALRLQNLSARRGLNFALVFEFFPSVFLRGKFRRYRFFYLLDIHPVTPGDVQEQVFGYRPALIGTCLVFEDSEMGIQAASAAGMASVRVPSARDRAHSNEVPSAR